MANSDKSSAPTNSTKIALVTGAGSGIGRAIALRLVADGLRVFGTSRKGGVTPHHALPRLVGPRVEGRQQLPDMQRLKHCFGIVTHLRRAQRGDSRTHG